MDRDEQKRFEASERFFCCCIGALFCVIVALAREVLIALEILP